MQAEHPRGAVAAQRRGQRRSGQQRRDAAGEVLIDELGQRLAARVQADQRVRDHADLPGPAGAPAQGGPDAVQPVGVAGVLAGPADVEITLAFGQDEVHVQRQTGVHRRPAQQRPGPAALQISQPCRRGTAQPGRKVRMQRDQLFGAAFPQPLGVPADRQPRDMGAVVRQQPLCREDPQRCQTPERVDRLDSRPVHRPARAAAYSAASVAADRWS